MTSTETTFLHSLALFPSATAVGTSLLVHLPNPVLCGGGFPVPPAVPDGTLRRFTVPTVRSVRYLVKVITVLRAVSTVDGTYMRTTKVVFVVFSMQDSSNCGC